MVASTPTSTTRAEIFKGRLVRGFIVDWRHTVRLYAGTPWGRLVAILALAVGMAFSGAFLSLNVDLVLRPNPGFHHSREISSIGRLVAFDLCAFELKRSPQTFLKYDVREDCVP